jgi:hypothetical protein
MARTIHGLVAAALLGLAIVSPARAEKIQQWKDENGSIHFSNVGGGGEEMNPETAPSTETAPAAAKPAAEGDKKSRFTDLSDETFSSQVSRERMRLRKEIQNERQRMAELDQKMEEIRRIRTSSVGAAIGQLAGVRAPEDRKSEEELELEKQKTKSEEKIAAIRKQYDEMHDEAVKRHGGSPAWWLPLD